MIESWRTKNLQQLKLTPLKHGNVKKALMVIMSFDHL